MGRQSRTKWERRAERERERREIEIEREARRVAAARAAEEGRRRGCLICRQGDGGFLTQEHIVPESLGNHEKILPNGVVCDRCNHNVCAPLDEALCSWFPIALMKTMFRVESKSGRLPTVKFDNGQLAATAADHLDITLSSDRWRKDKPAPPGMKAFDFTAQRHDLKPERLALVHRALVKQLLEYAWLDIGERVLTAEFDHEREIVLDGGHHGYIATVKQVNFDHDEPTHGMQYASRIRNSDSHPFVSLVARFWDVPLATDTLFAAPTLEPPANVLVWEF
jgi:hypothetical protein